MTSESSRRSRRELTALLRANQALASSLDLEQVLQAIVREAAGISGTSVVRLFLLDESAQVLQCRVGIGLPPGVDQTLKIPVGGSFSGQVAATGEPLAVPDTRRDPRLQYREHESQFGLISYLGLPIKRGDHLLGVLAFNTDAPRTYLADEIAPFSAFAQQAAIAIENARLHEMTHRCARQFAGLNDLTRRLTMVLDPKAVADEILAAVQDLVPGAAGRFWAWNVGDETLSVVAGAGLNDPEGGLALRLRPGEGLTGIVAATRQPVVSRDVIRDARFLNKAWAQAEEVVSCCVIPLVYGDRMAGALAIYTRTPHEFTDDEVGLIRSFGDHAATAMENARLFTMTERRAAELGLLQKIGQAITSRLDLPAVLEAVVAGAMQLLGTQHTQITLWDEATQTLRYGAALGTEAERVRTQIFRLDQGVNGAVARTRQPTVLDDYQASPYALPEFPDIVATITVPLLFGNRLLGVLHSHSTQPGKRFTPDDLHLYQMFAAQAAIAIENARLYEEVRRHAGELEARVQQRTAELEEAVCVKAQFLATMSHELRTPLNYVLGFAQLLQQQGAAGALTPKQAQHVNRIHDGGKHLLNLVNDILELSQVEAGQSTLQLEAVPLAPLVQEALELFSVPAAQKGLILRSSLDPTLPVVVADRRRLLQILSNLVGNAVKFTPAGGRVTVTARRIADRRLQIADWETEKAEGRGQEAAVQSAIANLQSEIPGDFLEIAVADTGIGLRSEDLERIFRGFVQVDASEARQYGGAGIGLTLVRTLVEQHGGRVWAESEGPGRGARFVIQLPPLELPPRRHILVVEDSTPLLNTLCEALENAGYSVESAQTGGQALEALAARLPNLLILDIGLPDMDGWSVLKRVREEGQTRALPVLVLTGLGDVHAWQAHALGANEFLAKPVSLRVLVKTVGGLLAQSAPSRGATLG